nr:hypothetical protein [Tanacetum cinerariifolium]
YTSRSSERVILPLAILSESRVTTSCWSNNPTLARRVIVSYMENAKRARRVFMSSSTDSTYSGGGGGTGGGDGSGDGNTNGKGDLDLLQDKDGKSDCGGEDDDCKSDGGDDDDGDAALHRSMATLKPSGIEITFLGRRAKAGLVARGRVDRG